LPALGRDPLAFLHEMAGYGPVAFTTLGAARLYMLNEPALIEEALIGRHRDCTKEQGTRELIALVGEGLLTSEGERWKRNRKLASPPLAPRRIAGYADTMVECAERAFAQLHGGQDRDVCPDMMAVTLEIAGKTLLGFDARGEAERIARILDASMAYFDKQLRTWHAALPQWVPTRERIAFRKARAELDVIMYGIIERCRASDAGADHLLARLLNARDDQGQALSDVQLRDEAVTMLLAGHETTAIALSFAAHLLATHPEVAGRLREELDARVGARPLVLDDLQHLPLLDAVTRETLRLYPPAWIIGREVARPFELGGYDLVPPEQVVMSAYTSQRDPRFYTDPERFDPERWLDGRLAELPKFAYFPFGGGPRICIGNHFATMELSLVLATLLQQVTLQAAPDFALELDPVVTLRPKRGVRVRITRRRAAWATP
jgi:cytochrome P450